MKLAVIPARGGSKRIPRKNIREFADCPMIEWSIAAALESDCFDRVVVSTDDDEIAEVATSAGAEARFRRPPELSDDFTPLRPVINHAIEWVRADGDDPQYVCAILSTAPFLRGSVLQRAYDNLVAQNVDFVFSASTFGYPIQRAFRLNDRQKTEWMWKENRKIRSQDLEEAYHDAGQFYWGRTEAFLSGQDVISADSRIELIPRHLVHDIDTEEDWVRAELVFRALRL